MNLLHHSLQHKNTLSAQQPLNQTPQGPRTMAINQSTSLDELLKQIYELETMKIYPQLALFEALSPYRDKHQPRKNSGDNTAENRRDFLDSFSYLCDIEKGGKTITAAALQTLPISNFLWLAANEGIRQDILEYARTILNLLKTAPLDTLATVQDAVFKLAVEKCWSRIDFYKVRVQTHALHCRMKLKHRNKDETVIRVRKALKTLSEPRGKTLEKYIDFCHGMRGFEYYHIKGYSTPTDDEFSQLAHYIWRLGKTRSASNTVVEAWTLVPSLRKISQIRAVKAPENILKFIHPTCTSPHEVLHGICVDSTSYNPMHAAHAFAILHSLDRPRDRPIHGKMSSRQEIITRVHAELQIADAFSRFRNREFVDGDKYIGCSKSACYFCYNWLSYHKHNYVRPATHHKIITGCRGPDDDLNEAGAQILLDMYAKISKQVGNDILDFLQGSAEPVSHFMSTEASTRATSQVSRLRR